MTDGADFSPGFRFFIVTLTTLLLSAGAPTHPKSNLQAQSGETDPKRFEFIERHMGTDFRILLYAPDSARAEAAAAAAFDRIEELDRMLSTYRPESELNRLSATSGEKKMIPVSRTLFHLLEQAVRYSELSGGAFDMTVGPFVDLWQRSRRTGRMAGREELRCAAASVGYHLIELDRPSRSVRLLRSGMKLDSGGIGKGYAADEALVRLGREGIVSALVDAGGDIAVSGPPPGREGWEIAAEAPGRGAGESESRLLLANRAIATSGDLYQFVEIDGVRYSHIIDPATGLGIAARQNVTVVAGSALRADVWATAIYIMGPERAEAFRSRMKGVEYLIHRLEEDELQSFRSSGFDALIE